MIKSSSRMEIFNLRKTDIDGWSKLSVLVESKRLGLQELWFSTPEKYADGLCTNRLDGFLVGMLFPAMQYGENIHLEGCVSKKLLFNLSNFVVPLLQAFSPSSEKINITADKTTKETFRNNSVATGFTGGVDSFCTIYDRYELENDPDYKINNLFFLNVGSHGTRDLDKVKAKFEKRYAYLKAFPDEIGLDFIPLDSNLHFFHPWGHLKTDSLTSVSGVLILQRKFKRYYYASAGFSYKQQLTHGWRYAEKSVADCCDPMIIPLLGTESLDFILDGMQMDRTEKITHIANYPPVTQFLSVCVSDAETLENCSTCSKCCRTLMTLDSLGKLNQFSHLFDTEKYVKHAKIKYVRKQVLLSKTDPFAKQNVELAKKNGVKLPSRITCYVLMGYKRIGSFLKKVFARSLLSKINNYE